MITIILLVSREDYLEQVISAVELQDYQGELINLLAVVDGSNALYVKTRNLIEQTRFTQRLTVAYKPNTRTKIRPFDILGRRKRIAELHNLVKTKLEPCNYIFGLEDDTVIPFNALSKLRGHFDTYPNAGVIQGIEAGRWGVKYLGAWTADDIYNPTEVSSSTLRTGLREVDGCGFYCFMTKYENYIAHDFKPFDNNGLGPDIDYSFHLRRNGLQNYTDFDLKCVHKAKTQDITVDDIKLVTMKKLNNRWRQQILS